MFTKSVYCRSAKFTTGDAVVVVGFYDAFQHLRSSASLPTEREKSDKFCSEALISAWGSFTCRKCTTRHPRLYFPSEGSHTQDFYALKKIHRPRPGSNPRTSDPEASMITTGPPGSTRGDFECMVCLKKFTLQKLCHNRKLPEIWILISNKIKSIIYFNTNYLLFRNSER